MNEERNKSGAATQPQRHTTDQDKGRKDGQGQTGSPNRGAQGQSPAPAGSARPGMQDKSKKDEGSCGCDSPGKNKDSQGASEE
jgi:hypothetical protein